MRFSLPLTVLLAILASCGPPSMESNFKKDFQKWQEERIEKLKSEKGWLNLAGLYWLETGENSIGSDSSNSIVFPEKAPAFLGSYFLEGDSIRFEAGEGTEVKLDGRQITVIGILTDRTGKPTTLESGSLAWFIIERGGHCGIRLRDYENPAISEFQGIETFPPSEDWVIEAEFERFDEDMELEIPTVLGTLETEKCPGVLRFTLDGKEEELYPTPAGDALFLIFADETSGLETYGGGRFLYIREVPESGKLRIDFNRAYNPPCAFTPFATCPLPPRQNYLELRIEAGEKFAGH